MDLNLTHHPKLYTEQHENGFNNKHWKKRKSTQEAKGSPNNKYTRTSCPFNSNNLVVALDDNIKCYHIYHIKYRDGTLRSYLIPPGKKINVSDIIHRPCFSLEFLTIPMEVDYLIQMGYEVAQYYYFPEL